MADIPKVRLTIDGISTEAEKGVLLVEAARRIGIKIPVFCSHSKLLPLGACRMCLVEIEKAPKLTTACTTPVGEGMVVHTKSPKVVKARHGIVEFLLANHPLDCPICDQGGECELQDNCFEFGRGVSRFEDKKRNYDLIHGKLKLSPVISWVSNRCIHCERCTRTCHEVVGDDHIGMLNRGDLSIVSTFQYTQMTCELCGNCAEVCPTGTITDGSMKYRERVWNLTRNESVCLLCGANCPTLVWTNLKNKVTRLTAPRDDMDCAGFLCAKGRFSFDADQGDQRLREGSKKGSETFPQCESVQPVLSAFKAIAKEGSSAAVLFNSRLSNEEAYLAGRIARNLFRTPHVVPLENNEGLTAWLDRFLGRQANSNDVLNADLVLLLDAPLARETPIIGYFVTRAVNQKGAALFTVGPEKTKHSHMGLGHIWQAPETSAEFVKTLMEAVKGKGEQTSDEFKKLVEAVKGSRKLVVIAGTRAMSEGSTMIAALEELTKAVTNSKVLAVPEGGNTLGVSLMGGCGTRTPGWLREGKGETELPAWISRLPLKGLSDQESVLEAVEKGTIKHLILFGEDLQESLINWPRWKKALEKVKNLVVFDSFKSDLETLATLAVPIRSFHEFEGSVLSAFGEWKIARGAVPGAVGQSLVRLLLKIEADLGESKQSFAALVAEVKKLSQWKSSQPPAESKGASGEGSKGSGKPRGESKKEAFTLLVGNDQYHAGLMTTRGAHLNQFLDRSLKMNAGDVEKLKLAPDAKVQLQIGNQKLSVTVKPTEDLMAGCCFLALNSFSPEDRAWFEGIGRPLTVTIKTGGAA